MSARSKEILGVDVGGVIIDRIVGGGASLFAGDRFLETPAVSGVFEALARLQQTRFRNSICVVLECESETVERTLRWLEYHRFYERTGICIEDVYCCENRGDKVPICRRIGVTHFIDHRLEACRCLTSVPNCFLFRPRKEEAYFSSSLLPRVLCVESWQEVLDRLVSK